MGINMIIIGSFNDVVVANGTDMIGKVFIFMKRKGYLRRQIKEENDKFFKKINII